MRIRAALLTVVLLSACSGHNVPIVPSARPLAGQPLAAALFSPGAKIKHVVILVQENRTVDNLFNGLPGADTVKSGITHTGARVALKPMPFEEPWDPDHSHQAWVTDYDHGKMDGFDLPQTTPAGPVDFNYSYVPQSETLPYFTLAARRGFLGESAACRFRSCAAVDELWSGLGCEYRKRARSEPVLE